MCVGFVQAHIELQESLAATQKETLEGLQDATTKMMSQQAEAARYTAETARHIKEVSNYCLRLHSPTASHCGGAGRERIICKGRERNSQ